MEGSHNSPMESVSKDVAKYCEFIALGLNKWEACKQTEKIYKSICLMKKRKFASSKNDIGMRRGKHPRYMEQKRGPKAKFQNQQLWQWIKE